MDLSDTPIRYRILAFRGSRAQLRDYLNACLDDVLSRPRDYPATEEFEWELTASISRHPAGKGLRADG